MNFSTSEANTLVLVILYLCGHTAKNLNDIIWVTNISNQTEGPYIWLEKKFY